MRVIGLDIGTTSISAVVAEDGRVIRSVTEQSCAAIKPEFAENRLQSVETITEKVFSIKERLAKEFAPIDAIGVTGQMHGILYIDKEGIAVSPLYTWQDKSGELKYNDTTFSEYLADITGFNAPSGYGLVTDFANRKLSRVPENAAGLCNIQDYITMKLVGGKTPVTHISNAAGLGFYSFETFDFDSSALEKIGCDRKMLPRVTAEPEVIGTDCGGIPVTVAVGDNQASFLGSVTNKESVLVNIGTGSQVSVLTDKKSGFAAGEIRPFSKTENLLVGAPLCGGRSYALLKSFFEKTLDCFGVTADNIYSVMDKMAVEDTDNCSFSVDTRFCGTRREPDIKGAILQITEDNFTPQQLTRGFLMGMCRELYAFYEQMEKLTGDKRTHLVGSGNGVRKNKILQHYLEETFKMPLEIPANTEEAAFGAAVFVSRNLKNKITG